MIYLLDLNYTLVSNSPDRNTKRPKVFTDQIDGEEYHQWLIELLRPHKVIMITARPDKYREYTLARILEKTGWQPMEAYFNTHNERPPISKKRALETFVFHKHGADGTQYYGLESNPMTRNMYAKFGIKSQRLGSEADFVLPV